MARLMPIYRDIEVWLGNDLPQVVWTWPDGYTASMSCQLTIWSGETLLLTAEAGGALIVDILGRKFFWSRTVEESRLIPFGRGASYELEDRGGGETTVFAGTVVGLGGHNLDTVGAATAGQLDFSNPANSGLLMLGWF